MDQVGKENKIFCTNCCQNFSGQGFQNKIILLDFNYLNILSQGSQQDFGEFLKLPLLIMNKIF
jgi:hypothetical protein